MTFQYCLNILKTNTSLKLSYKRGRFYKLETISGKALNDVQIKNIHKIIPPTTDQVDFYAMEMEGKVTYEKVEKKISNYTQFLQAWFSFYEQTMEIKPKFTNVEGNSLKQIISYLTSNTGSQVKALEMWQTLLSLWNTLDDFHKRNPDLKYINSNLNRILTNVKRNNTTTKGGISDDYLNAIRDELCS